MIMAKFEKGHKKLGGKVKGTPNKATQNAKEAFQLAFEGLGGVPAFIEWARKNQTDYYKLYSKVLPLDVKVAGSMNVNWPLPKTALDD